jgi:Apea-like HEPN
MEGKMVLSDLIVPRERRSAQLKEQVLTLVDAVAQQVAHDPALNEEAFPFVRLVSPWLADLSVIDKAQREATEAQKSHLIASGFLGEKHSGMLQAILASDTHLRACCRTTLVLAFYLDRSIINPAVDVRNTGGSLEKLDSLYERFESLTYDQGQYARTAYTHIFNLRIDTEEVDLGGGMRLVQVHESVVPMLLGEAPALRSFLHPPATGNVFLSCTQTGESAVSDEEWQSVVRARAHELVTVLQYLKDGIVNVGYSVLDFKPAWVNELRKFGLVFIGDPRRLAYKGGTDRYELDSDCLCQLNRWRAALNLDSIKARMHSFNSQLRLTIERAGTYYEGSHERTQADERLISLSIALESMFSPNDQSELSYRICQFASLLLGGDASERLAIFDSFREMYKLRSKLVHGTYDVQKYKNSTFVTEDRLREWANLIRRGILSFVVLYLRGWDETRRLHDRLEATCFDERTGVALRAEAQIEPFLLELGI